MLDKLFADTFEHLGIKALYEQEGSHFKECLVLVKAPEQSYELADGQFIERIATFELRSADVPAPAVGNFLYLHGRKYKVFQEPLLDPSGNVYEVSAILVGGDNV